MDIDNYRLSTLGYWLKYRLSAKYRIRKIIGFGMVSRHVYANISVSAKLSTRRKYLYQYWPDPYRPNPQWVGWCSVDPLSSHFQIVLGWFGLWQNFHFISLHYLLNISFLCKLDIVTAQLQSNLTQLNTKLVWQGYWCLTHHHPTHNKLLHH